MTESATRAAVPPRLPRSGSASPANTGAGRAVSNPGSESDELPLSARILDWMTSYDAVGFYCSFFIHVVAFAIMLGILWILDLLYLDVLFNQVDPIRAALADEMRADEEPELRVTPQVQIETLASEESAQDSAVALARSLSEQSHQAAQVFNLARGADAAEGTTGDSLEVVLPRGGNAVTKGSFTAWTVPERPAEGKSYMIVIEIKLPNKTSGYRISDLSGMVIGSDNYKQKLPWDQRVSSATMAYKKDRLVPVRRTDRVRVVNGKVQIVVRVPGARSLVRDLITIRSRVLKEEQSLELTFGGNAADNKNDKQTSSDSDSM